MKLSEAIRRGCQMRPLKIVGRFCDEGNGACALGAAMLGSNAIVGGPADFYLFSHQHPALHRIVYCSGNGERAQLWNVIADLNDNYDVTREDIADWIAWLEEGGAI